MDILLQKELHDLLVSSLDGSITDTRTKRLNEIMDNDTQARRYCIDFYFLATSLKRPELYISAASSESQQQLKDLHEFASYEMTAESVKIPQPELSEDALEVISRKPAQRTFHKTSLITTLILTAAMVLLIVWARFTPIPISREVATLTDSIDAGWDTAGGIIEGQKRFSVGFEGKLTKGFAKLLFDSQAGAVIEAPADFKIAADNQIILNRGRLYAIVPQEAIGFTVTTRNSRIIDLGTEFGVEANADDTTELHVLRGKTSLVSGEQDRKEITVTEGHAKRISGITAAISDINCNESKFARNINHRNRFIWRGENISLASIAAGHDGFQEVNSLMGLNPVNGKHTTSVVQNNRKSNGRYNPVGDSDFIDGVFVPDGQSGPIQVTSLGNTFDCPDTSGIYTHEIAVYKGPIENQHTTIPPVMINGQEVVNDSVLMLHSNTGITFDLQAIRNSLPRLDLKIFKATGVPMKEFNPDMHFWVLVDGQIKYEKKIVTVDRDPISLNIELGPHDQFLTLIVTDGLQATGDERKDACSSDFFYLIKPELCLTDNLNP